MRFGFCILVCLGCGRIGFDPYVESHDANTSDLPFSMPVQIAELNTVMDEDDVSLTGDMHELYFISARTGTGLLYRSTRNSTAEPWSTPTTVDELNTGNINNPRVATDGLAMVFTSTRAPNAGLADIWIATRPDRTSVWSPRRIDELATANSDFEPFLVRSDALELFFCRAIGGDSRPSSAIRATPSDPFTTMTELVELNGSGYDGGPWVDATTTRMLFHSHRNGSDDIFYSARDAVGAAWHVPSLMPAIDVNTAANDNDPWMSPDGHTFVFVSDRDGDYNIYMTTR